LAFFSLHAGYLCEDCRKDRQAHTNSKPRPKTFAGEMNFILQPRLLLIALGLIVTSALGCSKPKARVASLTAVNEDRRIELLIRSQYQVPATYDINLGPRSNSTVPGFYDLPVSFSNKGKHVDFTFLISHDGNSLARLQKFDLTKKLFPEIATEDLPVRGNPAAKVTIVVFDDFECPFCARFHEQLYWLMTNRYKNLVKVVYKPFPLTAIHPWAMHAAVDAACLAAQNSEAYWDYVAYVHRHLEDIEERRKDKPTATESFKALDDIATDQGTATKLDLEKLRECLAKQDESAIRPSLKEGQELDIHGTPSTFINGERIIGVHPDTWISASIDRALQNSGTKPPESPRDGPLPQESVNINAPQDSTPSGACSAPSNGTHP